MHAIQERLQGMDSITDAELVDVTLVAWKVVCEENESHKHLVTPAQWNQWTGYKDSQQAVLEEVIEGFNGTNLADGGRAKCLNLLNSIAKAGHKTEAELITEGREKIEQEAAVELVKAPQNAVQTVTTPARKKKWRDFLRKMIGS